MAARTLKKRNGLKNMSQNIKCNKLPWEMFCYIFLLPEEILPGLLPQTVATAISF
jgi:hypothetical protein